MNNQKTMGQTLGEQKLSDSTKGKESAATELRRAHRTMILRSLLLGMPLGYVASYWFQPYHMGLDSYIRDIAFFLFERLDITAWTGILIGGFIVQMLSSPRVRKAEKCAKAIMTEGEFKSAISQARRMSFGKIKASEDNLGGSVKRMFMLIPLAFLILIGFVVLLVTLFAHK